MTTGSDSGELSPTCNRGTSWYRQNKDRNRALYTVHCKLLTVHCTMYIVPASGSPSLVLSWDVSGLWQLPSLGQSKWRLTALVAKAIFTRLDKWDDSLSSCSSVVTVAETVSRFNSQAHLVEIFLKPSWAKSSLSMDISQREVFFTDFFGLFTPHC